MAGQWQVNQGLVSRVTNDHCMTLEYSFLNLERFRGTELVSYGDLYFSSLLCVCNTCHEALLPLDLPLLFSCYYTTTQIPISLLFSLCFATDLGSDTFLQV
jgi:hypothetical protein